MERPSADGSSSFEGKTGGVSRSVWKGTFGKRKNCGLGNQRCYTAPKRKVWNTALLPAFQVPTLMVTYEICSIPSEGKAPLPRR